MAYLCLREIDFYAKYLWQSKLKEGVRSVIEVKVMLPSFLQG